jgi:hypothetical protein
VWYVRLGNVRLYLGFCSNKVFLKIPHSFQICQTELLNLDLPSISVCFCIRFYLIMNKGNNEGNRWYLKISFFVRMSVIFQSQFNRTAGEFQKNDFRKSNLSHDEEEVCSMSIIKHIRIEHTTCTSNVLFIRFKWPIEVF